MFRRNISPPFSRSCDITPCSPLRVKRCFGGTYRLLLQGRRNQFSKNQQASRWQAECLLVFAELISSTVKMEAICSSETSVETPRTTRRHIPEYDTLYKEDACEFCALVYGVCYSQSCIRCKNQFIFSTVLKTTLSLRFLSWSRDIYGYCSSD
jgi:hypothetical protein